MTVTTPAGTLAEQALAAVAELTAHRQALGLTQAEVATRMGTSQSAVSLLEACTHPPMWDTLERYTAALGRRARFTITVEPDGQP